MTQSVDRQRRWGEVEGREIVFPLVVDSMNQAVLTYQVPAGVAQMLVPGGGYTVTEDDNGQATFVLALVDYVENPWGDYQEVNFGFLAHPTGEPEKQGSFVYRMPVNQEFTAEAGNRVLGVPKTVERITFEYTDDDVEVALWMESRLVFTVKFPRVAPAGTPEVIENATYSYLDTQRYQTMLEMEMPTGFIDPAAVEMELGASPVAEELRGLQLPKEPVFALWGENLKATFQYPEFIGE